MNRIDGNRLNKDLISISHDLVIVVFLRRSLLFIEFYDLVELIVELHKTDTFIRFVFRSLGDYIVSIFVFFIRGSDDRHELLLSNKESKSHEQIRMDDMVGIFQTDIAEHIEVIIFIFDFSSANFAIKSMVESRCGMTTLTSIFVCERVHILETRTKLG